MLLDHGVLAIGHCTFPDVLTVGRRLLDWSSYSAQCMDLRWIHTLHQFTERLYHSCQVDLGSPAHKCRAVGGPVQRNMATVITCIRAVAWTNTSSFKLCQNHHHHTHHHHRPEPPQPPGVSLKHVSFAELLCELSGWAISAGHSSAMRRRERQLRDGTVTRRAGDGPPSQCTAPGACGGTAE